MTPTPARTRTRKLTSSSASASAILLLTGLLTIHVTSGFAQTTHHSTSPIPTPASSLSAEERQNLIDKVIIAVSDAQLANAAAGASMNAAQAAAQNANQVILSTRSKLGYDSTYEWDFQKREYRQHSDITPTPPAINAKPTNQPSGAAH